MDDEVNPALLEELNELKSEVKTLRAIIQALMYVIVESQDDELVEEETDIARNS